MLTLNPNTASRQLCLSEGNRKVTRSEKPQSYPDHPERYDTSIPQVLCRESLSGRSYWEVEWKGELGPDVAVTYKTNVKLFGIDYRFGNNNKSWSLKCSSSGYSVWHNNKGTKLTDFLSSSRKIGIYLDNGAGSLAFYSISDTMTLLHRVQTTFDEPLYAGFGVYGLCNATGVLMSSTVTLCQPK
ncbi:STXB protein, partial [Amia calva]|nr:STXB protein [Amia calva]